MARPSNAELVKRAERTRSAIAEADPHATAALLRAKRRLLERFAKDADFWYEAARCRVLFGTTKDDDPAVKLIMAALRSFIPEQRTFPVVASEESVRPAYTVTIVCPPGSQISRGTAAARDEAIEVRAQKQLPPPVGSRAADGAA